MVPGSLVCLLSSQSVSLAGLPPRLICSQRDSEPNGDLNGQPTEGFFHEIVFHSCYTLASAAACIPELPRPPFQCFSTFNVTGRTLILSSEGVLWGAVPLLVPAQTGAPVLVKRLCFPEHPCWEGDSSVEDFHLGWNAEQTTGVSSITRHSLAVKGFSTTCCFVLRASLDTIDLQKKKKKRTPNKQTKKNPGTFPKCKGFCIAHLVIPGNPAACAEQHCSSKTQASQEVWSLSSF